LLALRSSPPVFTDAQAERIARDTYGLAVAVRGLPGERDRNFHLRTADQRDYVLKIVDFQASPEAMDCQLRVLQHLAEQDPSLPVPRLFPTALGGEIGTVSGRDRSYATCLMGYLPGRLLAERKPGASLLDNLGDTLARVDHALQGFFHPALAQRLAWDVRRLPELIEHACHVESSALRRTLEAAAAALEERLPGLRSLRSQAIHGDCHAHNLLVDADARAVTGILDFGDMIHAPRVFEPAVALSELLTEDLAPLQALSPLLEGYVRRRPLESDEVEALYDLIVARHAVTILVHAWRGRHDAQGAQVLDRSARHAARSLEALTQVGREALTRTWHRAAGTHRSGAYAPAVAESVAPGRAAPAPVAPEAAALEPDAPEPAALVPVVPEPAAPGPAAARSVALEPDSPEPAAAEPVAAEPVAPIELSRRHRLMGVGAELFYERPLHLVRGSGVWLYDAYGRAYLDVYNNVAHVGHAHPTVVGAIQRQTAVLSTHTRYLHARILDYAERLTATLPGHLDTCIFVNSGSEANDVAWRIAQATTGHTGGLVMQHAYHGITDAVAALTPSTGEPRDPRVATLAVPRPEFQAYDAPDPGARAGAEAAAEDADRAIRTLSERGFAPAAFFLDTAITSSGIHDPPPAWAAAISDRVRAAGVLIVADEVQYGLGRSGSHFWGFARRGLDPDIVTLGKPVGNGYPMGVVIAARARIEAFQREFGFFSTFGGNPVAASAGLAVLDVLEREQLMANAAATGDYLRRRLGALEGRHPALGAVRGTGLLLGLEVRGVGTQTARQCAKRIINILAAEARVLIGYEGPDASILKLRPPMPFAIEHADRLVQAIEAAAQTL
jgi:4-aminobutyrate aminotransferase-like enzyme/Ser/Thr protein kinase RdoA (MazF antagonist)